MAQVHIILKYLNNICGVRQRSNGEFVEYCI
jgi:hypothetical protein